MNNNRGRAIEILMVEDNPADARLIYEMINETRSNCYLDHGDRLNDAPKALIDNSHHHRSDQTSDLGGAAARRE